MVASYNSLTSIFLFYQFVAITPYRYYSSITSLHSMRQYTNKDYDMPILDINLYEYFAFKITRKTLYHDHSLP